MSKAFTSEENEDALVPGRAVQRSGPGEERPITRDGHRRLLAQRDAWREERGAVAAGSDRARELDHRLALVHATLESVRVVEAEPSGGIARFGSVVTLRWDDGRAQRVTLVGPDEAEGDRVSILAPLGRALVGVRAGTVVEIERPRGVAEATVVAVND